MSRTGGRQEELRVLSQESREPRGAGQGWSSVSRWELCCVAGWKGRRYRVEPKGYFLFVFFCLFSKLPLPPASCTEHGPGQGPVPSPCPQPLCWPFCQEPPHPEAGEGGHKGRDKKQSMQPRS